MNVYLMLIIYFHLSSGGKLTKTSILLIKCLILLPFENLTWNFEQIALCNYYFKLTPLLFTTNKIK